MEEKLTLADASIYLSANVISSGQFQLLCRNKLNDLENLSVSDAHILHENRYITDEMYFEAYDRNMLRVPEEVERAAAAEKTNYEGKTDIVMK